MDAGGRATQEQLPRAKGMDAGGTSPRMGEDRIMQEQLSRVTQDAVTEEARSNLMINSTFPEITSV